MTFITSLLSTQFMAFVIDLMKIGSLHALLLDSEGKVYSYGQNCWGQLGLLKVSVKEEIIHPQVVSLLEEHPISLIACGGNHSIALSKDGEIWVWGSNEYGQLGLEKRYHIVQFPININWHLDPPLYIACGENHTLIATQSELYSFGKGSSGQLGTGSLEDAYVPTKVPKFSGKRLLLLRSGFGSSHNFAVTEKGVYGWGRATRGQLGIADLSGNCSKPRKIPDLTGQHILDISCGWYHTATLVGHIPPFLQFETFRRENRISNIGRFNGVANDNIQRIVSFIQDAKSVTYFGRTAHFFLHMTSEESLWERLVSRDFPSSSIPQGQEPPNWKLLYKSSFLRSLPVAPLRELLRLHQIPPKASLLSGMKQWLLPKTYRILMVGLEAAGKTTILYRLKMGLNVATASTLGYNEETIVVGSKEYVVWDVGGLEKMREYWRNYIKVHFPSPDATVFVLDSSDEGRLGEALAEWKSLVADPAHANLPCLILANKQDLPGALPPDRLSEMLGLNSLSLLIHLQGTISLTATGLPEGFSWLNSILDTLGR
eukprot:TRINITY_DN5187_c0_g1_i10.p1 TRINITY_DN5187_c0_g1~~TRINITY_DN5187_c0_g1_i10.p1  ORF type:complete len:543 (-),score=99.74 TRINITY_DN5187_c0_g1_i10:44-1672(-)